MILSLIALYILIFGGGSGIETLFNGLSDDEVEDALKDDDARAKLLELSKQLDKDLAENDKAWQKRCDTLLLVQHDYGSLPVDFEAQFEHLENRMIERQQEVLKTRSAMKKLMSAEEWDKLFSAR